ncbi:MAG: hypothetical protein V1857_00665 [archaeon]
MRKNLLLILLAVLTLYEALVMEATCTPFAVARISQVQHPNEVQNGKKLTVLVTCEYTSRVLADVGIFETDSSRVVESITLISETVGPGNVTFTFTLIAPLVEGDWNLVAITRAWWADSWFSDPTEGSRHFKVRVADEDYMSVKLEGVLVFELDGVRHNHGDPTILRLKRGLHLLTVEATRGTEHGVRLVFDRWSDGVQSNPRSLFVTSDLSLTAQYRKEYRLTTSRGACVVGGDEWYDVDIYAELGTSPEAPANGLLGEFGLRSIFERWEGDVNSNSPIISLRMDKPKTVTEVRRTILSPTLTSLSPLSLSAGLLIGSLMIITRLERRSGRGEKPKKETRFMALGLVLIIVLLTLPPNKVEATGNPLIQTGLASWRHWGNTASSTCLIWIGGGVSGQNIMINPYWLESFNTMRYVQDLGNSYGILTLEQGGDKVGQPQLNRTIDAESYPGQSLQQARRWAHSVGYRYVFLVGYSVGGIAALNEVASADPDGWRSPNGVILITVPVAKSVLDPGRIRANLLLLYGEKMDEIYTQSGKRLYAETADEGLIDGVWFHKEIHVLEMVAHEVWTIADSGRYDTRASFLTVSFIERSKSLQLNIEKSLATSASERNPNFTQLDVRAPRRVRTESQFRVEVQATQLAANQTVDMVAYDEISGEVMSVETFHTNANAIRTSLAVCPPARRRIMQLAILVLARGAKNDESKILGRACLEVDVTNEAILTILSPRSQVRVRVDERPFQFDSSGLARINVTVGLHALEVSQTVEVAEGALDVFESWSDGVKSPRRMLVITDDLELQVVYKRLYRIDAISRFGTVQGTGWHEANSSVVISVKPTAVERSDGKQSIWHVFCGWRNEETSSSRITAYIDSPASYTAQWNTYARSDSADLASVTAISGSILLFIFVLMRFARRRGAHSSTKSK